MTIRNLFSYVAAVGAALTLPAATALAQSAANDHTVLILATTVDGGATSKYAQVANALGYDVELATEAQWSAKSTTDFASYRAIVFGDPTCTESLRPVQAAEANTSVWGPAIDGNVLIIGTDPMLHAQYIPSATEVVESGLAYVLSTPKVEGKTGAYISLSCYFNESGDDNSVELLKYFGSFIVDENTTCHDDVHIVEPEHPAMSGLTDAELSNWDCSIHALFTQWPSTFLPLVIADGLGTEYTAADGHTGTPYILSRSVEGGVADCGELPTITVNSITPSIIWPPNNKMVDVYADVTVSGDMVNVTRTITVNEVVKDNKSPIYEDGADVFHFKLRADRNGSNKDGRTYTITFTGTDACGETATATTTVYVPHDQGKSDKTTTTKKNVK
jgi:hypothetical protein